MASFYVTPSSRRLAEAIAAASEGEVIDRPLSRAVEVHGSRLVVTREMIRADLRASGLGEESPDSLAMERTTWEMLKRNATGTLKETETSLILEGATGPGEEPKRGGCMGAVVAGLVGLIVSMLIAARI